MKGRLVTNGPDASILMGITRDSILEIARDLAIPTEVRAITVDELFQADELFFSGTAVEVTPIREIDGRAIASGSPGPMTKTLQKTFFEVVRGRRPAYRKWLTAVKSMVI